MKAVVAIGFAAGLLLSIRMWVSTRSFPLTPVWEGLPSPPYPFDYLVLGLLIGLLVPVAILPRPRAFIVAFAIGLGVLALLDQQRWQPWPYQYVFMLGALALYGPASSTARRDQALDACRVVAAGIYIWSGLHKFNVAFVENEWPWLTEALIGDLPRAVVTAVAYLGYAAPVLELSFGIGLLTRRFRHLAIAGALSMQAFILLCIGPWGLDFNSVVWPWNVTMAACVVLLFWRAPGSPLRNVLFGRAPFGKLVVALFLVMPAFHLVGLWDSFLSATLYTGNTKRAFIYTSDAVRAKLPADIARSFEPGDDNELRVIEWAFDDLNAPVIPEERVYRRAAGKICGYAGPSPEVVMVVQGELSNRLVNRKPRAVVRCSDL